jgi:glucan phosphoethanolaminetransferase (alkaline phosphatase superfamily)
LVQSGNAVTLSRVLIPLFGLLVWFLFYLNVRCAYRLPKSGPKTVTQLSLILAAVGIFVVQVNLMNYLAPQDSRGSYFFSFVLIECGGGTALMFYTGLRERAKIKKTVSSDSNLGN